MSTPAQRRPAIPKAVLCPFCGTAQFSQDRCSDCKQPFTEKNRKQAQIEMGPWYLRNKENPFLPGHSYQRMRTLAESGVLKANSVVRGPATQQFWLMAKFAPGISHLVGFCFACPAPAKATDTCCTACRVPFKEYPDRNSLGLRYKTEEEVQKAKQELAEGSTIHKAIALPPEKNENIDFPTFDPDEADRQTTRATQPILPPQAAIMDGDNPDAKPFVPGADLLDDIFGIGK